MRSSSDAIAQPLFLITHEFYPVRGGIATFAEEIARASTSLGYDVEVWAQSAPAIEEKMASDGEIRPKPFSAA